MILKTAIALIVTIFALAACSDGDSPTVTPSPTSSASPTPTATASPTSNPSPEPTETPTVIPTQKAPPPTPLPDSPFLDNDDCADISRQLLRTIDVEVSDGERSVTVEAELAESVSEQSQGLMCRSSIPEGTGMLFTFASERSGGFWMFNTYAPIEIIYSASSGEVDIIDMEPCPRNTAEAYEAWRSRCASASGDYAPYLRYTAALELPQGWLESLGFDTDDPSGISISY